MDPISFLSHTCKRNHVDRVKQTCTVGTVIFSIRANCENSEHFKSNFTTGPRLTYLVKELEYSYADMRCKKRMHVNDTLKFVHFVNSFACRLFA